ncbi:unnamed protein product [Calicophoron daubneyi]|uniref:Uncharacterized protein n=1 Tax=Calicophoron daubneyi TaxID=300641 RepID=A0AAV2T6S1_CALDB
METQPGRLVSELVNPPDLDYRARRSLFLRTTTWSLNRDSSSDTFQPDAVGNKDEPNRLTPAGYSRPDTTTNDEDRWTQEGKDSLYVYIVTENPSSVGFPLQPEDVIVRRLKVENSPVRVTSQLSSSVPEHVIARPDVHSFGSQEGACGELCLYLTEKPKHVDHTLCVNLRHNIFKKRGYSLGDVQYPTRFNSTIYRSSDVKKLVKKMPRPAVVSSRTNTAKGSPTFSDLFEKLEANSLKSFTADAISVGSVPRPTQEYLFTDVSMRPPDIITEQRNQFHCIHDPCLEWYERIRYSPMDLEKLFRIAQASVQSREKDRIDVKRPSTTDRRRSIIASKLPCVVEGDRKGTGSEFYSLRVEFAPLSERSSVDGKISRRNYRSHENKSVQTDFPITVKARPVTRSAPLPRRKRRRSSLQCSYYPLYKYQYGGFQADKYYQSWQPLSPQRNRRTKRTTVLSPGKMFHTSATPVHRNKHSGARRRKHSWNK